MSPRWRAHRRVDRRAPARGALDAGARRRRRLHRGFLGDDRYIVDYLVEEVLQRQPEHVRSFLLQTSILDLLSGPLCDAVTGQRRRQGHAGGAGPGEPVPGPARRPPPVVPLPPPLRRRAARAPARRAARTACPSYIGGRATGTSSNGDRSEPFATPSPPRTSTERRTSSSWRSLPCASSRQEADALAWLEALPDEVLRGQARAERPLRRGVAGQGPGRGRRGAASGRRTVAGARRRVGPGTKAPPGCDGRRGRGRVPPSPGRSPSTVPALALVARRYGRHRWPNARRVLDLVGEDDQLARGGGRRAPGTRVLDERGPRGRAPVRTPNAWRAWRRPGTSPTSSDVRSRWRTSGSHKAASATRCARTSGLAARVGAGRPVLRGAADMHVGMSELCLERNDVDGQAVPAEEPGPGRPPGPTAKPVSLGERPWPGYGKAKGTSSGALDLLDEAELLYMGDFFPNVRPIPAQKARVWLEAGHLGAPWTGPSSRACPSTTISTICASSSTSRWPGFWWPDPSASPENPSTGLWSSCSVSSKRLKPGTGPAASSRSSCSGRSHTSCTAMPRQRWCPWNVPWPSPSRRTTSERS